MLIFSTESSEWGCAAEQFNVVAIPEQYEDFQSIQSGLFAFLVLENM